MCRDCRTGWQAACAPPGAHGDVEDLDGLSWIAARVPGTAAGALQDAGLWRLGEHHDFDAEDWWFRTSFDAEPVAPGEEVSLCLDGIATVADVYLNGERVLESDSMFATHRLPVGERLRCPHPHPPAAVLSEQRAGDPLPCPRAAAGKESPSARALAYATGPRAQPALLSHDAARPGPGLCARPGHGWSLAGGAAGAPAATGRRGARAASADRGRERGAVGAGASAATRRGRAERRGGRAERAIGSRTASSSHWRRRTGSPRQTPPPGIT